MLGNDKCHEKKKKQSERLDSDRWSEGKKLFRKDD